MKGTSSTPAVVWRCEEKNRWIIYQCHPSDIDMLFVPHERAVHVELSEENEPRDDA